MDLLNQLNFEYSDIQPVILLGKKETLYGNEIVVKNEEINIAVCMGGDIRFNRKTKEYIDVKRWPFERYAALIEKLLKSGMNVYLIAGMDEMTRFKIFNKHFEDFPNYFNYMGKCSLIKSAAIVSRCDLAIGNDTGMIHISAALGITTLAIFGSTNPKLSGAVADNANYLKVDIDCQFCYDTPQMYICNERKCLNLISVEMVHKRIIAILDITKKFTEKYE